MYQRYDNICSVCLHFFNHQKYDNYKWNVTNQSILHLNRLDPTTIRIEQLYKWNKRKHKKGVGIFAYMRWNSVVPHEIGYKWQNSP